MVSTLPLLKQLVLTILSTLAAKWVHLHRLLLELRWVRLSLMHGAPAAPRQQDIPGCASSSGTNSICSRTATNSGSRELWSMACAFIVCSGERDDVPRVEDAVLDEEIPPESCGGSISIKDVANVEDGEGLLPRRKYSYQDRGRGQRKLDSPKRLFCSTNTKVPGRAMHRTVPRLRLGGFSSLSSPSSSFSWQERRRLTPAFGFLGSQQ